jgi:hypothetical protein
METSRNFARIVDRRRPGVEQSRLNERVLTDWLAHRAAEQIPHLRTKIVQGQEHQFVLGSG